MTQNYPTGTRVESERLVREWGFRHIFTWTDGRYVRDVFCGADTPKMGVPIELPAATWSFFWTVSACTDADLAHQQRPLFPALT